MTLKLNLSLNPFFEGLARTFDFAGSFDEISPPLIFNTNPVADDWRIISDDYNNSLTILNSELNEDSEKSSGK